MTNEQVTTLGNALLGKLMERSIKDKFRIAARAGLDMSGVPGVQNNAVVNPAIAHAFGKLGPENKIRALPVLADALVDQDLTRLLHQHGYEYFDGTFVPVDLIDEREARHLSQTAMSQLAKAINRLSDNDESGAITAACGAVDATTTGLYDKYQLGDQGASFQAKVNTVINRLAIIEKLERELTEIGVKGEDARKIAKEVHEATKHAVEALQVIRRTNGDVHGAKPTYKRIVYDTIKWASAICGLLEGE